MYIVYIVIVFNFVFCCMYFCFMFRWLFICYKEEIVRIVKWWLSLWFRERGINCWRYCVIDILIGRIVGRRIVRFCILFYRKVRKNIVYWGYLLVVLLLWVVYRLIVDVNYFIFNWFINRYGFVLWESESRFIGELK